jgi:prefoldin subunit 5
MSNETVTYSLEAVLTRIEGKIDSLQRDVNKLEIGQSELKGEIKTLDDRLTTEIKGLRLFVTLYAKSTDKMPRQHTSNPKIPKVSQAIASPFY